MAQQSNQSPESPAAAELDLNLLAARQRVIHNLLLARQELIGAQTSCVLRRDHIFPEAAGAIQAFIDGPLPQLIREVVPMLDRPAKPGKYPRWDAPETTKVVEGGAA